MNSLASTWHPSSKGSLVAASMASMAARGAIRLRCFLRAVSRAAAKIGAFCSGVPSFWLRSRVLGAGFAGDLAGESDGAFQQVAVDQLIHDAGLQRICRLDWIAVGAHLNRFGDAGETGQALRARSSRNETEFHFRLSDLRAGHGDAVVAGHGHFQAAAESRAVNRHHHRLGAVFYFQQKREQSGAGFCLARSHLGEFFDVGARDESAAASDDDGGDHGAVCVDLIDGFGNSFGHAGADGIHRRIIDGDDGNVAVFRELDQVAH